ncbi:MAG TPA: Hsp20/alpha crystallin family protein [Phycisphaerales bacterium]|nr:Hsp20/alpha crystallin family protein [Phycisphaerales bacterium]
MNLIRTTRPAFVPRSLIAEVFSDPFFTFSDGPAARADEQSEGAPLALDVSETERELLVRASLPGFRKEDINVQVREGVLTISAQRGDETEERTERYHRRERYVGSVSRSVALPVAVDEEKANAQFKDGVLTLILPKQERVLPRKINIT